jgi:hypothetical protein
MNIYLNDNFLINKDGEDITFVSLRAERKLLLRNKKLIDYFNELFEDLVSLDLSKEERILANETIIVKLLTMIELEGVQ